MPNNSVERNRHKLRLWLPSRLRRYGGPSRQTLGMMADANNYAGNFQVNGECISEEVRSWIQSSRLHVCVPKSRLEINIRAFNANILGTINQNSLGQGVSYSISGPDCALVKRGPLGHPGDGEFDSWGIDKINLSFRYDLGALLVSVGCLSERGSGGFSRAEGDLSPILLSISFVVPHSELKHYLQISDSAWGFFQENLSHSRGAANA